LSETVYIGLGSNLGDREKNLIDALEALGRIDAAAVTGRSSLYDSAPVGPPQPRYLNAVVALECPLPPQRLLCILKQIELDLGRTKGPRWAARPLDLDLLLWEGRIIADPNLQVPHLELHRRRFALEPLCELAADAEHPVMRVPLRKLLAQLEPQDVVRHPATHWPEERLEHSAG
jgi:2-amino-4-hydroxy-6-hydroxymethyldihydropteridine diphosphokinase